jgi:hypothetical protein
MNEKTTFDSVKKNLLSIGFVVLALWAVSVSIAARIFYV